MLERRIVEKLVVDDMQFGFRQGKGLVTIFVVKTRQRETQEYFTIAFVEIEKAFDRGD